MRRLLLPPASLVMFFVSRDAGPGGGPVRLSRGGSPLAEGPDGDAWSLCFARGAGSGYGCDTQCRPRDPLREPKLYFSPRASGVMPSSKRASDVYRPPCRGSTRTSNS